MHKSESTSMSNALIEVQYNGKILSESESKEFILS